MARPKSGRYERKFFVAMDDAERDKAVENMKRLRKDHNITLSELLRKVIVEHMNDEELLKVLGLK